MASDFELHRTVMGRLAEREQRYTRGRKLIVESLMTGGGVLRGMSVIQYVPGESVLGLEIGDRISLTAADFERLSEAFLAEIERRFL